MGDKFTDMISSGSSQEQKSSDRKRMTESKRNAVLQGAGINAKKKLLLVLTLN